MLYHLTSVRNVRRRPWCRFWVLLAALTTVLGCSKTMTLYTVPRHPEAEIYVNGQLRGKGSAQVKVNLSECGPRNMGVSARLGVCESYVDVRTQLNTTAVALGVAASVASLIVALAESGETWSWSISASTAASGIALAACNHEWPDSVAIPIQQCLDTADWSVTVEDTRLYAAPSFSARVLGGLPRRTCVRIEHCQGDWCQVTVLRPAGGTKDPSNGFVYRPRLQPASPAECPSGGVRP